MKRHQSKPANENDELDVHPIIRQIINRDCHVAWSNRTVIKHVISKLKHGRRTYRAMPREDRRRFIKQCIKQHRENWELYRAVMLPTYASDNKENGQ